MKIEWQADDITPGRIVGSPDRSERWMIGYVVQTQNRGNLYCLVSLSDGMMQPAMEKAALAVVLNNTGDIPVEFFSDPSHVKRGQKGGAARAASLSPQRRAEIASAAANARWNGTAPSSATGRADE